MKKIYSNIFSEFVKEHMYKCSLKILLNVKILSINLLEQTFYKNEKTFKIIYKSSEGRSFLYIKESVYNNLLQLERINKLNSL
jgi:hypothetical protein